MSEQTLKVGAWTWTLWPTFTTPTEAWLKAYGERFGGRGIDDFHRQREERIANEQNEPIVYGWEQPPVNTLRALLAGTYTPGQFGVSLVGKDWKQAAPANDVTCLGGNGSGKTEVQAKFATECLLGGKKREARCFSQNETTSVRYVQRAMFRYLPRQFRGLKSRGLTTKISYKEATGFSESIYILPNHSAALFPTYKAWEQDRKSVEGGECDILTWDEEAPAELLETARFRVHKKGGFVLGGFTPVGGYTETVGQYIEGATILEAIPARRVVWDWQQRTWAWGEWMLPKDKELVKGCPPGHVPYVVQSGQGNGRRFAVTFPTMFNPYTNVQAIIDSTTGKPLDFLLERLWGWPTKLARKAFPNFGPWHIVEPDRIPPLKEMTLWHWTDPHGKRNWFMLWLGVDKDDRIWVIREWPDIAVGEWALPGAKPDGKPGPAQTAGGGKSFGDYKRIIREIEGWRVTASGTWEPGEGAWHVTDYRMDPRPAETEVPSDEERQTFLDYMNSPMRGVKGETLMPGIDFAAGPHVGIEEGVQFINDWLTGGWNPNEPVTPLNCPRFYISSACENTIWALRTYTGADGEKGACKDAIDGLKGLAKLGVRHLAAGALGSYGGWGGY